MYEDDQLLKKGMLENLQTMMTFMGMSDNRDWQTQLESKVNEWGVPETNYDKHKSYEDGNGGDKDMSPLNSLYTILPLC